MTHRVGVAKAARLLGVNRDTIQHLIRNGELTTFEGEVELDELHHCFPGLEFNQGQVLEKMQIIKDQAFGERVQVRVMPEADTLQHQIKRLKVDLGVARAKADKYKVLIEDMLNKLTEIQTASHDVGESDIGKLNSWLLEQFKK